MSGDRELVTGQVLTAASEVFADQRVAGWDVESALLAALTAAAPLIADRRTELAEQQVQSQALAGSSAAEAVRAASYEAVLRERDAAVAQVQGLIEVRDQLQQLRAEERTERDQRIEVLTGQVQRVQDICTAGEHGALRWADPLQVPPEIVAIREIVGGDTWRRALDGGVS